ncbi:MAG: hypothetical protein ABWZ02_02995 [Nakamurella sp.]
MNYLIDPANAVHEVHRQELLTTAERSRQGGAIRKTRRRGAALRANLRPFRGGQHSTGAR